MARGEAARDALSKTTRPHDDTMLHLVFLSHISSQSITLGTSRVFARVWSLEGSLATCRFRSFLRFIFWLDLQTFLWSFFISSLFLSFLCSAPPGCLPTPLWPSAVFRLGFVLQAPPAAALPAALGHGHGQQPHQVMEIDAARPQQAGVTSD